MNMLRLLSIPALLTVLATVSFAADTSPDAIASLADQLLPVRDEHAVPSFGSGVASDVAEAITDGLLFSFLVFLPFLVIPQILLLVVIFKFRERGDGRKESTFVHNNKLELAWTAVPILALIIVAIPAMRLLYWQETPPDAINNEESLSIEVVGKQFAWDYNYPEYDAKVALHADLGRKGLQRPIVLEKDRTTHLFLTSADVNHAWWVPAFGVKKDCFIDRHNHTWFTPTRTGYFEGQCAELCGEGHGIMMISAVVLEKPDFKKWVAYKRFELDAQGVIDAFRSEEDIAPAIASYLGQSQRHTRDVGLEALEFWLVYFDAVEVKLRAMTRDLMSEGNERTEWEAKLDTFVSQAGARRQRLTDTINGLIEGTITVAEPVDEEATPAPEASTEPTASTTAAEEAAQ